MYSWLLSVLDKSHKMTQPRIYPKTEVYYISPKALT